MSRSEKIQAQKGLTLLELMVTLAVAAILLSAAVPSFMQMAVRNRLTTYTNDYIASINFARSEAIRRGGPVAICASNDGASCAGAWSDGWIVFANLDGDMPAVVDNGEPVLRVYEALSPNYTLNADPVFAADVTFAADGSTNATGALAVCYQNDLTRSRAIVLTRLRPRVARDTDDDRVPNLDAGNLADCANPSGGP